MVAYNSKTYFDSVTFLLEFVHLKNILFQLMQNQENIKIYIVA